MAIERPQLILADDPALPVYPIEEGETRVGRASSNDISIKHRSISRHHFTLERTGDQVRILPCGKNVTRIDDEVAVSGQLLRDGQTIKVGARELIFRFPADQQTVESDPPALPVVRRSTGIRQRRQRPSARARRRQ